MRASFLVTVAVLHSLVVQLVAAQAPTVCGTILGNSGPTAGTTSFVAPSNFSMDTLWLTEVDVPPSGLKIVGFRISNAAAAPLPGVSVAVYESVANAFTALEVPFGPPLAVRSNFTLPVGATTQLWDDLAPLGLPSNSSATTTVLLWLVLSSAPSVDIKIARASAPLVVSTAASLRRSDSSSSPSPRDFGSSLAAVNISSLSATATTVGLSWALVGCANESSPLPPTASYTPTPSPSCIIPYDWPTNATYEPCVPSRTPNPSPTPTMPTQSVTPSWSRTPSVTPTEATRLSLPPAFLDPSKNVRVSLRVQITSIIFSSFDGLPGFLNDGGVSVMLSTMSVSVSSWSLQAYSLDDPEGDWLFCIFNVTRPFGGMSPVQQARMVLANSQFYPLHGIPVANVTVDTSITDEVVGSAAVRGSDVSCASIVLPLLLMLLLLGW